MSGGGLSGAGHLFPEQESTESYLPGDVSAYDRGVIDAIIERHCSGGASHGASVNSDRMAFEREVVGLKAIIPAAFPAQYLLDALVLEHEQRLTRHEMEFFGGNLTALVQALYGLGHDGLVLDLSRWQASPISVARFLTGSAEHPLRLTYVRERGTTCSFGSEASHLAAEVHASLTYCGHRAADSSCVVHGSTIYAGDSAERCAFTLLGETWPYGVGINAAGCSFHIADGLPEDVALALCSQGRGNRLFVPGEEGGWRERLP